MFIDTHTHLYEETFDGDRRETVERALAAGVEKMYLPNCDSATIAPMMQMAKEWPGHCCPMMGLHPCSVNENFQAELDIVKNWLDRETFYAVGEIGLDFHWDTTFAAFQLQAFEQQIDWAVAKRLPVVIHTRKSLQEGIEIVRKKQDGRLRGVFHCFGGSPEEARQIIDLGFYVGIGGVATFKNSGLNELLKMLPLENILLETDAPYLAPVPYRGKRNESAYIPIIAQKIADIKECPLEEVAGKTTANAESFFTTDQGRHQETR